MTKINSTPSIAKQRIHASFVERNRTIIDRASSVEPVNPVNPVQNNIGYSSANHLMTSDLLYDKLEDLKRDYLDFYNHERNLHRAIDEINLDEEIQLEMMKNLLDKYNRAIIALSHFDHQLRTNNVRKIKEIILEYRDCSTPVGIVRNSGRPDTSITITTLDGIDYESVDMLSVLIVGNSNTFIRDHKIITPRGYNIKWYGL